MREMRPGVRCVGVGGPVMRGAGCELLEETTGRAVMGAGAVAHALEHRRRVGRIRDWLKQHAVEAVVPTDSPAANWAVCQATRDLQPRAMVLHLAAPQLWAWAGWRIKRMRRLSDGVLCLLPFERAWFEERGVRAWFVGHPVMSERLSDEGGRTGLPGGGGSGPRLALLPGSRAGEVKKNWPLILSVWARVRGELPGATAVVVAADDERAAQLISMTPGASDAGFGQGLTLQVGGAMSAMASATAGVVVSGTATLHAAAAGMPTVAVYRASRLAWAAVGRWLMETRTFTLPNLIGEAAGWGRVIPEFIPNFGDPAPVADAVLHLLRDPAAAEAQRSGFTQIRGLYEGVNFRDAAARTILEAASL